ncbi:hypothetical protein KIV66_gp38 [Mycobacterium phage MyraDee]|uniref:Uncharacterized protein n=1 Tax=Mycobacterium phage MyraDee TaxID=2024303 RepID=A0A222Z070_9CAUD|nr:hypothetical protein KIV66_gp38 [Mycobacterium phage MyraDee]ASR77146.1 hypothetical protein SEA_MYRADEE_38 [Mycobacterium phage MyraDee]
MEPEPLELPKHYRQIEIRVELADDLLSLVCPYIPEYVEPIHLDYLLDKVFQQTKQALREKGYLPDGGS